mmetsp:Transcript_14500/g.17812  ORF Transcript_14500/g.17812 Transcript_14500/m.17812 type:complete len:631 (+) Transcript_14500:32-1924(+)
MGSCLCNGNDEASKIINAHMSVAEQIDKKKYKLLLLGAGSSGKSTLLNAILGSIVAETDISRTTTMVQCYYESENAGSSVAIHNESRNANEIGRRQFEEQTKKYNKYSKQWRLKKLAKKFIMKSAPKKPSFGTKATKVNTSCLIPKTDDMDNTFNLFDFPGLNDAQLDTATYQEISKISKDLDIIFYVMDCNECLRKESSQNIFDAFIDTIKTHLQESHLKLVIIFNKYDTIVLREKSKKFVKEQCDIIRKKLINKFRIPPYKFEFLSTSATHLLVRRILLTQDTTFLEQHERLFEELMDEIYQYADNFMSRKEIREIKKKKTDEQLRIIRDKMDEQHANDSTSNDDTKTSDTDGDGEGIDGTNELDSDTIEGLLYHTINYLKKLRDISTLYYKAKNYALKLDITNYQEIQEFFVCIYCLIKKKVDEHFMLEDVIMKKLLNMAETMKSNTGLKEKCIHYALDSLQLCIESLNSNKFSLKKLIKEYTLKRHLNSRTLNKLFDENISETNKEYYYKIGKLFVDALCEYYMQHKGQLHGIITVDTLVKDICRYYHNDIESQKERLVNLLTWYPSNDSNGNSQAKDLMLYYFDLKDLRKLFTYHEYDVLCSKNIKKYDYGFQELIQSLKAVTQT